MTRRSEALSIEEKIVIFFDICSSSTIVEDLLATNNMMIFALTPKRPCVEP